MSDPKQPAAEVRDAEGGVTVEVRDLLNAQTGRLSWEELQRHFARGVVIRVRQGLDLVEVAGCIVADDRARVERWTDSAEVEPAQLEDAKRWAASEQEFWAVVVSPWILVQEI